MKYGLKLALLIFFSFVFVSFNACSNQKSNSKVLSDTIKTNNLSKIIENIKNDKVLLQEEIDLFSSGLARLSVHRDSILGKTIGYIIENQRNYQRESSLKTLEGNAVYIEMMLNHAFKFEGIEAQDKDTVRINNVIVAIQNRSDKEIKTIKGALDFYNVQNQIVKRYNIELSNPIKPGEALRFTSPYPHDPNNQRDVIMREQFSKLNPIWQPWEIEFSDGKKLVRNK